MSRDHTHIPRALLLAIAASALALAAAEGLARVWIAARWSPERRAYFTVGFDARDGQVHDPVLGHRPQPGIRMRNAWGVAFRHNELGFRGDEISRRAPPGATRVVLMGASTIYGFFVEEDETSAVQLERRLRSARPDLDPQVVNAGVPGWTSRETLLSLEPRVLSIDPDVILVMDGRNDVFPQLYDDYRDDYSHYRKLGFDFRGLNAGYRSVFRWSHLAMLLTTSGGGRFGYSFRDEHPLYGFIRYENQPDLERLRRHLAEERRTDGFRRNLEAVVETARGRGVEVVLATIPFLASGWEATGVLRKGPRVVPLVTRAVHRNNEIVRALARRHDVPLVEAEPLSKPELLYDDCHLNPMGERALARRMVRVILPLLENRR